MKGVMLGVATFAAAMAGAVAGSATAAEWQTVYATDFSANPGWVIYDPAARGLGWDGGTQTFLGTQNNADYSYAYIDIPDFDPNGSWRLEFDSRINSCGFSAGMTAGLFDAAMSYGQGSAVVDRSVGTGRSTNLGGSWANWAIAWTPAWSAGYWYRSKIEYDNATKTLTLDAMNSPDKAEVDPTNPSWHLSLPVASFPTDMTRIGVSRVDMNCSSVTVNYHLDNVVLSRAVNRWTSSSDGTWDDPANWSTGVIPRAADAVRIAPANAQTIAASSVPTTIESLIVGAQPGGWAQLETQPSGPLTVSALLSIESLGTLRVNGAVHSLTQTQNHGRLELLAGSLFSGGPLLNAGIVTGSGQFAATVANQPGGEIRVEVGHRIIIGGSANTNAGRIQSAGGEIEFSQALTNQAAGTIALSGNSYTTFYGDMFNAGLIEVSAGSTAVFFGSLLGADPAGTGRILVEGGQFSGPGASVQLMGIAAPSIHSPVDIQNDSAEGLIVGGTQTVGALEGAGSTTVLAGGALTATSVMQDTLTIGTGSSVTIRETTGGRTNVVPEPSPFVLLGMGAFGLFVCAWRRRSDTRA